MEVRSGPGGPADWKIAAWSPLDGGAVLRLVDPARGDAPCTAGLELGRDGTFRLRAAVAPELPADPAPAVGRDPFPRLPADVRERTDGFALRSPGCETRVEVDASPFRVRVLGRSEDPIAELSHFASRGESGACATFRARAGERFYGFGETEGPLEKTGARLRLRNRDPERRRRRAPLYVSIPFFLALRRGAEGRAQACGVFLESFAPSRFDVAATDPACVAFETDSGGLDVQVVPGPDPASVVRRFTARVGRTPLPPAWALGHHQSRWSYASDREVRELAARIRERRIPTDAIHLDIDHMHDYRVFTWHPSRFPDPKQLLGDLARAGLRAVAIVDPGVKVDPADPAFREGEERDVFCRGEDGSLYTQRLWPGAVALPDFNREDVRAWWGELHRPLVDAGVSGIWNDMNEPAGWSRDVRLGRTVVPLRRQDVRGLRQRDPARTDESVSHEAVRNLYGFQQCRATRSFLDDAGRERRAFVLSRSGYAGIQRYAAVWTGDNRSHWADLRDSIPMLLNLSLSGVAFCGADIGGFFSSCTPELYARWIQLGALYPFARTHTIRGSRRQEPWSFGARVEVIARESLELRMRLLPYLYGLFREAEQTGSPVWRPLFYEFPDDPRAAECEDQVMVGPSLLLAPVVSRGARERSVYLPPGPWISWHDDARFTGPRTLRVAAPLERLPLFARGGSVLPTRSPVAHAGEIPAEPLVLEVFPGADRRADLVEDDGESKAYLGGVVARTSLRLWDRAGGRLRLEIGRREGPFAIPERRVRVTVRSSEPPQAVFLDGSRLRPTARARATPRTGLRTSRRARAACTSTTPIGDRARRSRSSRPRDPGLAPSLAGDDRGGGRPAPRRRCTGGSVLRVPACRGAAQPAGERVLALPSRRPRSGVPALSAAPGPPLPGVRAGSRGRALTHRGPPRHEIREGRRRPSRRSRFAARHPAPKGGEETRMSRLALALLASLTLAVPASGLSFHRRVDDSQSGLVPEAGSPESLSGRIVVEIGELPVGSGNTTFDVVDLLLETTSGLRIELDPSAGNPGLGVLDSAGAFLIPTLLLEIDGAEPFAVRDVTGTVEFRPGGDSIGAIASSFVFDSHSEAGSVAAALVTLPEPSSLVLLAGGIAALAAARRRPAGTSR